MKEFYYTKLTEFFPITDIITIYHVKNLTHQSLPSTYNFWQLFYVINGEWNSEVESIPYTLKKGQMVFRAPGETHYLPENKSFSCEAAIISFACESTTMEFFRKKVFTLTYEEENTLIEIINTGLNSFTQISDDPNFLGFKLKDNISQATIHFLKSSLERLFLIIFMRSDKMNELEKNSKSNTQVRNNEFVDIVIKFMVENISNNLTLKDISKQFAVSSSTLKIIFKSVTGRSVMKYFNDLRIDKAKNLITDSTMTFSQIAEYLGFTTADYFTKLFKAKVGQTPTEYSKTMKSLVK